MNNFHTLSQIEQQQALRAMLDLHDGIGAMYDQVRLLVEAMPARQFDELRAPLGSIHDAADRLHSLFYDTANREPDGGIDTSRHPSRHRVRIVDDAADDASPHGIERPNLARVRHLDCDLDCSCRGGR